MSPVIHVMRSEAIGQRNICWDANFVRKKYSNRGIMHICKNIVSLRYCPAKYCCYRFIAQRFAQRRERPNTEYLLKRTFHKRPVRPTATLPSHTSSTNSMPELQSSVTLTTQEQELFDELLESSKQAGLAETTLRCAGGWVRDKLMGRESLDIDIALDNMMGKEFAERVNQYLESHGKQKHNVAVIMSNPDQSKHLETARMKIRGLWIDLVNLRSEEYAHNSRIPTMSFGTPEQDAYRRDFTINSLFYNINTKEVEDYTGRGIDDMKLGVIRTPLEAKETFLDDPLRVLRAIRFASRFGFSLDRSLVEAARDEKVGD